MYLSVCLLWYKTSAFWHTAVKIFVIFWRIGCALFKTPHRILVDRLTCSRDDGRWSWWSWRHWSCSQHPEAEVTTLMMMESLPLPRQNTNPATFAHSLEGSFRLLHFIVNSVQALFYVIELFCNHQTILNWTRRSILGSFYPMKYGRDLRETCERKMKIQPNLCWTDGQTDRQTLRHLELLTEPKTWDMMKNKILFLFNIFTTARL